MMNSSGYLTVDVQGHFSIFALTVFTAISAINTAKCINLIKVREYPRGKQKHKTNKNKTKTQHNMCWTPLNTNKHKYMYYK